MRGGRSKVAHHARTFRDRATRRAASDGARLRKALVATAAGDAPAIISRVFEDRLPDQQ
jgi:hypothetical protein